MISIQKILTVAVILTTMSCGTFSSQKGSNSTSNSSTSPISEIDFWKDYSISSKEYGTETTMVVEDSNRLMKTNALPNHMTGKFPNSGNPNTISAQNVNYTIPANPQMSGESRWARQPGFALNGVKFEPGTAERFVCETGEVYRIEAFQELVNLGLDFNHAHVQPGGAYHYHGVPVELVNLLDKGKDVILVGFALDGFPIYYSKSGQYKPSYQLAQELRSGDVCTYNNPKQGMTKDLDGSQPDGTFVSDWEYVPGMGQLDECNGMDFNGQYSYFVTDEYPYMSRCLKGIFKEDRRKGPPPGQHSHGHQPPHNH